VKEEKEMDRINFLNGDSSRLWWFCLLILLLLILLNGQGFSQASISGYTWMDENQNGILENGERGFSGVRVGLHRRISHDAFQELTSLRTETTGHYIFIIAAELLPGDFYLQFEKVPGYYYSPMDQGGDDLFDSDADSLSGKSAPFLLVNMNNANGMNAGYMSAPLAPPPPLREPLADLALMAGTIPDTASIGDEFTYVFDLMNFGPDTAKQVELTFPVSGLIEIKNVHPQPDNITANPLRWTIPFLAEGEQITFRLDIKILQQGIVQTYYCAETLTRESSVSNNCHDFSLNLGVAVELVAFTARLEGNRVRLQWTTASETENLGFYIYRANEKEGFYFPVNPQLIPGAGTSSAEHRYQFLDEQIIPGQEYFYKIADIDYAGQISWHGPIEVTTASPVSFTLGQNYPNPFNAQTRIEFQISETAPYELIIYNHLGQHVRTLIQQELSPGIHTPLWNGTDSANLPVSTGTYFYILRSNNLIQKKSMQLIK